VEGVFRVGMSRPGFMQLSKKLDEHRIVEMLCGKEGRSLVGPDGCKVGQLVLNRAQCCMH
jgi:hypothetical protein